MSDKNIENIARGTVEPRRAQDRMSGQGLQVGKTYKVIVCREDKLSECFETFAEYMGNNMFDIDFDVPNAPIDAWEHTWIVDEILKEVQ